MKHVLGALQEKGQKYSQCPDCGTGITSQHNQQVGISFRNICRKDKMWWEILAEGNRQYRTLETFMPCSWPHVPCSVSFLLTCNQSEQESGQTSLLLLSAPTTAVSNTANWLGEVKLKSCPHHPPHALQSYLQIWWTPKNIPIIHPGEASSTLVAHVSCFFLLTLNLYEEKCGKTSSRLKRHDLRYCF